ncbi:MAG: TatD family hydrolase, partial [Alphaproteobacteria bacterium]
LADHPKVVGIGETGLDYYYENSPREDQAASFRRHIEAARRTGLPLIVHTRAADEDTAEILREEMAQGAFSGVLHCFSAGPELARAAVDLGFYISFSGILTFPKAEELRRVAAEVPQDRLLVETDSPYLAPVPKRGKPNEPAFVKHTAARLAEIRGMPEAELHRLTTDNFFRLFSKARRPAEAA